MIIVWILGACLPDTFSADEQARIELLAFDPGSLPAGSLPVVDDPAAADLGRSLYVDATLSVDGSVSCLTCHDLCLDPSCVSLLDGAPSGTDLRGDEASKGAGGFTKRNAPTILETAYRDPWGWVGQFTELDDQNVFPLLSTVVYGHPAGTAESTLASAIREGEYAEAWTAVFGDPAARDDAAVVGEMGLALEAFLRTIPASETPLDRLLDGDEKALGAAEVRGLKLFVGKAHCIDCHSGPLLSDEELHVTALAGPDLGRATDVPESLCFRGTESDPDCGAFVTPPLRNVALTAPYMHDGSLSTLAEVVAHYDDGGDSPNETAGVPDPMIHPLLLDAEERADLVAFLASLGPS